MTPPATVADVLERAADLIAAPGAWTQKHLARNNLGMVALPEDRDAISFCGYGAVIRVSGFPTDGPDHPGWAILDSLVPTEGFPVWNDAPGRTQEEVVAKLREAATFARTEVQA